MNGLVGWILLNSELNKALDFVQQMNVREQTKVGFHDGDDSVYEGEG